MWKKIFSGLSNTRLGFQVDFVPRSWAVKGFFLVYVPVELYSEIWQDLLHIDSFASISAKIHMEMGGLLP